jgi:hypothetical protein
MLGVPPILPRTTPPLSDRSAGERELPARPVRHPAGRLSPLSKPQLRALPLLSDAHPPSLSFLVPKSDASPPTHRPLHCVVVESPHRCTTSHRTHRPLHFARFQKPSSMHNISTVPRKPSPSYNPGTLPRARANARAQLCLSPPSPPSSSTTNDSTKLRHRSRSCHRALVDRRRRSFAPGYHPPSSTVRADRFAHRLEHLSADIGTFTTAISRLRG